MFSSPPTTGMFRFVGFASPTGGCRASARRVAPFGHPRIKGRSRLPVDFRGLPRPSSPPGAKASSVRLVSLVALARLRARFPRPGIALVSRRREPLSGTPRLSSSCLLSFHPVKEPGGSARVVARTAARVENAGLEPATPGLQSRCSSRLSQSPSASNVVPGRLELPTPTLSVWCSNRLSYGTPSRKPRGRPLAGASLLACCGQHREPLRPRAGRTLQKGGVPAAPSGTATLLRLSPNHLFHPRPTLAVTDFRRPRLSWLDGRCVQGPGTYSPRHG